MTNPNGANQYQMDPRQKLCWDLYIDPKSETFSNGYQSALRAGYEDNTANQITVQEWFVGKCSLNNIAEKAEKNLNKFLESEPINDTDKRIQADMTKFALERLNKGKYSLRTELTGANGKDLPTPIYGGKSIQGYDSNEEDIPTKQTD